LSFLLRADHRRVEVARCIEALESWQRLQRSDRYVRRIV
jgi:hypothetical protein